MVKPPLPFRLTSSYQSSKCAGVFNANSFDERHGNLEPTLEVRILIPVLELGPLMTKVMWPGRAIPSQSASRNFVAANHVSADLAKVTKYRREMTNSCQSAGEESLSSVTDRGPSSLEVDIPFAGIATPAAASDANCACYRQTERGIAFAPETFDRGN
jgi:hypothetical protein